MKKYLGLILLLLSFNVLAKSAKSTTAVLLLRANVPVSYKVNVRVDKHGIHPSLKTNALRGHARPKFEIKKSSHSYIVSVVHP